MGGDMLDARLWSGACVEMLSEIGVGVVACDAELRVLERTPNAHDLLTRFAPVTSEVANGAATGATPASIVIAIRDSLAHGRPVRVEGRIVLSVRARRVPALAPIEAVASLRE